MNRSVKYIRIIIINEIPNRPDSTLMARTNIFDISVEETEAPPPQSDDIIIPKGKSEWEIIKVINSQKRTGNSYKFRI